ncbi:MAG: hypothetical protein OEU26_18735 [Candidatus Tectomicrobia bacterium]|nr:hypothetical protein [Candidatus Tectomicrobia bacterium]
MSEANGKYIRKLDRNLDFSKMSADESLYIVGHGVQETGEIRGIGHAALLSWLNDANRGIPDHIKEIVILTCYGGMQYQGQSLAEKIANGLNHMRIPVYGAKGFTFGSTTTMTDGRNRVLPSPSVDPVYAEFYNGNNVDKMLNFLKTKVANKRLILTLENGSRKVVLLGNKWEDKLTDEEIQSWARRFIAERDRIEARMAQIVANTNGQYMSIKVKQMVEDDEFTRLIQEQQTLFDEGELFAPVGEDYVRIVRG